MPSEQIFSYIVARRSYIFIYIIMWGNQSFFLLLNTVFITEAKNTNFTVIGLTRPGVEPTIFYFQGEHASKYITDDIKERHSKVCIVWYNIAIIFV